MLAPPDRQGYADIYYDRHFPAESCIRKRSEAAEQQRQRNSLRSTEGSVANTVTRLSRALSAGRRAEYYR
jgi:hypothetical protein